MSISGRTIVLLIAAAASAFAAIVVRNHLSQGPAVVAEAPMQQAPVHVLVAKHDLSAGSFVQGAQDLDWGTLPENLAQKPAAPPENGAPQEGGVAHENYLYEGSVKLTDFNGAVVRRSLHTGDPIPQTALMKSGEGGFMSAVLEGGMRAVSIAVTATSGNAGFVSPGDHVDLIVTHRVKTSDGTTNTDEVVVSQTFTQDVRVVAVDQMLDNPDNKAILAKTITVEVTPRQAEQIAVAAEMGKISLALRSLTTPDKAKPAVKDVAKEEAPAEVRKESEETHALKDLFGSDVRGNATSHEGDNMQIIGHNNPMVPRVMVIHGDKSESIDFYQGKQ